ncbi:hypothetical protein DFH07DRAFT_858376 [Mycena maculata]|uniref:Annexin n=1 Tax=Mycena maculata TaxID=230809 RepID=A0AAD7MJW7_9AGAR|nr:hypothetical protein DFH07DRAFT_858376 [Mycena maculata]
MWQPPNPPPIPNAGTYPGGFAQGPPPPGSFPTMTGQASNFPAYAPSMPGAAYPPPLPRAPYPPPLTHPGYAPQYLPPAGSYEPHEYSGYGAPKIPERPPALGFPSFSPGPPSASYPPASPAAYAGFSGNYAPPPGPPPGTYQAPYGYAEPPTILYRGVMIHNPNFPGGLQIYETLDADIKSILNNSDTETWINNLTRLDPLKMEVIVQQFPSYNRNEALDHFIKHRPTLNSDVRDGLRRLILGPLKYDVDMVHAAIKGNEKNILNEIILDLSPEELHLLEAVYQKQLNSSKSLPKSVEHFLDGGDVKKLFKIIFDVERPILPNVTTPDARQLVAEDVHSLYKSGEGRLGTDEDKFHQILAGRTPCHLTEICRAYHNKDTHTRKKPLSEVIKKEFSGDDKHALLFIVRGAEPDPTHPDLDPRAIRDARLLEETMVGMGTREKPLVMRLVRAHWSRARMEGIKAAYVRIYGKTLLKRVEGETSGTLKDFLRALIEG